MEAKTKSEIVLAALRANAESSFVHSNGGQWAQVYLDNARPTGMTNKSFRSCLAALSRRGLYISQGDDCFGDVRLT
jgi:hypothetical protein